MKTITFFSPKGGAGRTIATLAAAAGFVNMKSRVGILDLTHKTWGPGGSEISRFEDAMVAGGAGADEVITAPPAQDRASMRAAFQRFENAGCDYVLVDAPCIMLDLVEEVVWRSDLVVMPFTNYSDASIISEWGMAARYPDAKIYGLAMGLTGSPDEQAFTRRAFHSAPLLDSELRWSRVSGCIMMYGGPYTQKAGKGPGKFSAADLEAAQADMSNLCTELAQVISGPNYAEYLTQPPLGDGSRIGHVEALREEFPPVYVD